MEAPLPSGDGEPVVIGQGAAEQGTGCSEGRAHPAHASAGFGGARKPPIVFLIAIVLLGQGISAPFQKDAEPQSAQWIADIVRHHNWLLPRDYYGFVQRKPPLFYWLAAVETKATGGTVDERRARVVSLVAGAALAAMVMAWTSAQFGEPTGWIAFLFLIGSYGFASRSTTALTDMLLTCILFAAYVLVFPLTEGVRSRWRTCGGAILIGLATLTKGPVALVLIGFAIAIYCLLMRRNPLVLAARGWPWAIAAGGAAIAAIWYAPAFLEGRAAGFAAVFADENFGHFMPASMGGTGEAARPFYYVAIRLMGGMLPLSLLTPALMLAIVGDDSGEERSAAFRYQLALAISVLGLFSIASAKRDDYILPAIPSLAILFATLFREGRGTLTTIARYAVVIRDVTVAMICGVMLVGTLALFLLMRLGGDWGHINLRMESSDASYAAIFTHGLTHLSLPYALFVATVAAGATMSFAGIWRRRPAWSGAALGLIAVAGSVLWTGVIRPAEARTRSVAPFAAAVRGRVGAGQLYVAYDDPEFAYYAGWGVPALPRAIARNGPAVGQTIYLVARPRELMRLAPAVRASLELLIQSGVEGGGGAPALYLMRPPPTSSIGTGLKDEASSNK